MWWYFVKKSVNDKKCIYLFAFESRDTTGELEYDKANGTIKITKYAENTSEKEKSDINSAMYHVIKSGLPDKRTVAYG